MLILRIRQAEIALADGRLDEAFEQAMRNDVRQHRRGQRLVTRLVDQLMERGQAHAQQCQYEQALADCERAARLGGNQPRIGLLRQEVLSGLQRVDKEKRRRRQLVSAARQHIDRGELTVGAKLVQELDEQDSAAERLSGDLAARRVSVDAALTRAQHAIADEAFEAAVPPLLEARRIEPNNSRLAGLSHEVAQRLVAQARESMQRGRLDLATSLMDRLQSLAVDDVKTAELKEVLSLCQKAVSQMEHGSLQQACHLLSHLDQVLPNVPWVQDAIQNARQASAALETLRNGPLGMIASHAGTDNGRPMARREERLVLPAGDGETRQLADRRVAADVLPSRFLMQVDGAGSFLVARGNVTTIGPISSSRHADVALLIPAHLPLVHVERREDDYFLRCDGPIQVNGKPVTEKLLTHGDRIVLGNRFEIRFFLPNAASTSAVLEMSGARLPRQDVRRVILLDESIVLGRSKNCHVNVHDVHEPIVLHLQNGQLHCRMGASIQDRGVRADSTAIAMGTPKQLGPMSIVLTEISRPIS